MPDARDEWERFATEAGGTIEFDRNPLTRSPQVRVPIEAWTLTSDVYMPSADVPSYTLFSLDFVPLDGFEFNVDRAGGWLQRAFRLGKAGVAIDPVFDRQRKAQSNDPDRLRSLLADSELRRALLEGPPGRLQIVRGQRIRLSGKDFQYVLSGLPESVAALHYAVLRPLETASELREVLAIFRGAVAGLRRLRVIAEKPPPPR
jgi:hypothetical protein